MLGLGALSAGLLSLMLPETAGQSLPETLEDGERLGLVLPRCLNQNDSRGDDETQEEEEAFSRE